VRLAKPPNAAVAVNMSYPLEGHRGMEYKGGVWGSASAVADYPS
jgi:hypothetical protein